jgi:hypothetical protein
VSEDVELDAVDEGVIVDGSGVRGSSSKRLAVELAGQPHIVDSDGREGQHLDSVDVDLADPDGVATPGANLGATPQSDGDGDVTGQYAVAKLRAELDGTSVERSGAFEPGRRLGQV